MFCKIFMLHFFLFGFMVFTRLKYRYKNEENALKSIATKSEIIELFPGNKLKLLIQRKKGTLEIRDKLK